MVIYNIQSNGASSQLVVELISDGVHLEPHSVAYIEGSIEYESSLNSLSDGLKAHFIGRQYYKPIYKGTGKIYLKPTLGYYHKFTVNDNDDLTISKNAFVVCRSSIQLIPQIKPSLIKFLSGSPMVNTLIKGNGNVVVKMPGEVTEVKLSNSKFVAYLADITAYTLGLNLTREVSAGRTVQVFRGTGSVYFSPHPNPHPIFGGKHK